ncbi:hypothetical protein P12x_002191 [Tundrisphaera lichenicola]|uniref:hypothetical protein n=1 Tax=Tundrisphaera lichenicola TaxID=2029860 RepID=UPI003EBE45CC
MITKTSAANRRLVVIALAMFGLFGCSEGSAPAVADQDRARQTLDSALESWKKGETVERMKEASPAIVISDPKWGSGAMLKRFEVEGEGKPSGAERAFTVTLWLANRDGKESREQVVYKVGTDPILTVFRSLF